MELIYWLWLSLKRKISPSKAIKLISLFKSVRAVYNADEADFKACPFLKPGDIKLLCDKSLDTARREITIANRKKVTLVTYDSEYYPDELRLIASPPLVLYAVGELDVLREQGKFCIVGTRNSTAYGMSVAMEIAGKLASSGIVIVSGLAVGIDTAAHMGAVKAGGKTIGVLGCGIDVDYPAGTGSTKRSVCSSGVVISEFPFGTPAYGKNFPYRNRVLSAMSLGVAAIEGDAISGSLITARHALEQGKDVYALPGNITSRYSRGPNTLLEEGAKPIVTTDDILEDYVLRYPHLFGIKETKTYQKIKSSYAPKDNMGQAAEPVTEYKVVNKNDLTQDELSVLAVMNSNPMHRDEIMAACGLPVSKFSSCMVGLQIKKYITELPGGYYKLS